MKKFLSVIAYIPLLLVFTIICIALGSAIIIGIIRVIQDIIRWETAQQLTALISVCFASWTSWGLWYICKNDR